MDETKKLFFQETSPEYQLLSPAGRNYSWCGLKKLAAALCELSPKCVDDREHGCKNSTAKGTNPKNE